MELVHKYLNEIKIPLNSDNVYKDECLYSFDNPESSTGIYISLSSFLCFGEEFVDLYSKASGTHIFLHLHRTKKLVNKTELSTIDCQPEPKITKLAIGIEGGFQPNSNKFEYQDNYNIVVFPGKVIVPYPNEDLPLKVQHSINGIIKIESARDKSEKDKLTGTWDGEIRKKSKYALELKQLENGKLIPPTGWKCENCDLTENLWLNLTDGSIMCGRRNFDGSGGNNHAVEHFKMSGYPLAVKLGTISSDNKADVFSYLEDEMVLDPKLSEHLNHFGINIHLMEKSEKSMIELELDINKRIGEWSTLTESESKLTPISGPGFTGMMNMGNYCYMNSVMQVLFIIPDFINNYVTNSMNFFKDFPIDPANNFNIQMAKLGTGLWNGKYSSECENSGINPQMFKHMIGKNHVDFSTNHQQDALDFYLHVANTIQKNCRKSKTKNPMDALKFCIEDRVKCTSSGKVKYTNREEYCLSLNLPIDKSLNIDDLSVQEKGQKMTGGNPSGNNANRPRISFQNILDNFAKTEKIEQYFSSAINGITTAEKYSRFASLPDFLFIQFKKFTLRSDWVPIKLDVAIDNIEELDLSPYRGFGKQPNEETLPDTEPSTNHPVINQCIVDSLTLMGFPVEACKKAVFHTKNSSVEEATEWIMQHITDSDINDPFTVPGFDQKNNLKFIPDSESLTMLMNMGFDIKQATKALKETNNNIERATDWIFSHPEIEDEIDCEEGTNIGDNMESQYRDGSAKYKLVAFISHMGPSSHSGHYVCHIFKDDKWIIFNDNKVAISQNPPKDLGYLYLYKRDI